MLYPRRTVQGRHRREQVDPHGSHTRRCAVESLERIASKTDFGKVKCITVQLNGLETSRILSKEECWRDH